MDVKNLVLAFVGITIAGVMVGGALLPIIAGVTAESDTYINDGYFDLKKYTQEDTLNISWSYDTRDQITVNGEVIAIPLMDNGLGSTAIILSVEGAGRITATHDSLSFYGGGTYITGNSTNTTFTVTYAGGTLTVSNVVDTKNFSNVTQVMCIANAGNYVMKKIGTPAYVNGDSEIFANNIAYFGSQGGQVSIWGIFDDLQHNVLSSSWTMSDVTKVYTESDNHNDLYLLDSLAYTVTYNSTPKDFNIEYFVVEKEVTAERTEPMNRTMATMFNVLPIVTVAGLLMAGIYVFIIRK